MNYGGGAGSTRMTIFFGRGEGILRELKPGLLRVCNDQAVASSAPERMSETEMEAYAREGILPAWFKVGMSATPLDSQDAGNDD